MSGENRWSSWKEARSITPVSASGRRRSSGSASTSPHGVPEEAAMVHPLTSYDPSIRGEIVYPPAFDVVNQDR